MTCNLRSFGFLSAVAGMVWILTAASAQTVAPEEAVQADGTVKQAFVLTPVQRHAIYDAVIGHRGHISEPRIATSVGSPVPPTAVLYDLPIQAGMANEGAISFKYATVEDQVLLVDPLSMTVVDVIGRNAAD